MNMGIKERRKTIKKKEKKRRAPLTTYFLL